MAEYIDREAVIAIVRILAGGYEYLEVPTDNMIDCIKTLPAADVKPVVRGEWRTIPWEDEKLHYCSNCKLQVWFTDPPNFCSNCGSEMSVADVKPVGRRKRCCANCQWCEEERFERWDAAAGEFRMEGYLCCFGQKGAPRIFDAKREVCEDFKRRNRKEKEQ